MSWNESNVARLRELWDQGLPTAQIGKLLGFTKNAVVGKAHRIGLERRPSPIRRTAVKPDRKKARSPIVPKLNFEASKEETKEIPKQQSFQPVVKNLFTSLILAIFVIAILMSFLFKSYKMVLVSLFPNLIPLIFTSALMGYFGIAIKPSTILVFSIAFGISIDDTIHFLAKYRQELKTKSISDSVEISIKETGVSMIYTSIILFFGFSMFIASEFGGTQALGILVSLTLFVAMLTNLILLPSLLLSLEQNVITKSFKNSEDYFYDDSDIELDKL